MTQPKILYFDLEWKPAKAYVWKMWDENISPDQLLDPGGMLCFSANWSGDKNYIFYSEWEHGHETMVRALHALMSDADAVVTYNGDKYDIPKANGEFLLLGLPPAPPVTSIDLLKAVKKMGFVMNRLAYIAPFLKVGAKVKHEGFRLWADVMNGDEKAQERMKKYCLEDTKILVALYEKIKPYIRNHPHLSNIKASECGACGSTHVHSRGFRRTKAFRIQRLQCQSCGAWSDGTRQKV